MNFEDNEWRVASMSSYPGNAGMKCTLKLSDGELKIRYTDRGMQITYTGRELGHGHFRLTADVKRGVATLHRFDGDTVFEGYWEEDGLTGMWRIIISERLAT